MRFVFSLITILLCATAAIAQEAAWLVYVPISSSPYVYATRTSNLWVGTEPNPGTNVPAGSLVIALPGGGDGVANDYLLDTSNNTVSFNPYIPPAPAPAVPANLPNVQGFEAALWADGTITIGQKLQIVTFFPLLEGNINNPTLIEGAWAAMVATYGSSWLDSGTQTIIENYATTYNIPLMP